MTENFVTIFDSGFLLQGLALHRSLQRCVSSFRLWVICVDEEAYRVLDALRLPGVTPLSLPALETAELQSVKGSRTRGEYCWTLTPFAPRFVFEADPSVARVTYVDADLWFRRSPAGVFREFEASGKQVLITDHAYAPEYDQSATSGQYCVQFMTFSRGASEPVRRWWEQRCIEWCFARLEEGRFGDQKYLDTWPELFAEQVHVLGDMNAFLAPWNACRIPYGRSVAVHFHGLRIYKGHKVLRHPAGYRIPPVVHEHVYARYLDDLAAAVGHLAEHGVTLDLAPVPYPALLRSWMRRVVDKLRPSEPLLTSLGR